MDKKEDASKRDNPRISMGWMNEWMNELMQLHSITVRMFLSLALKVNIGSELITLQMLQSALSLSNVYVNEY